MWKQQLKPPDTCLLVHSTEGQRLRLVSGDFLSSSLVVHWRLQAVGNRFFFNSKKQSEYLAQLWGVLLYLQHKDSFYFQVKKVLVHISAPLSCKLTPAFYGSKSFISFALVILHYFGPQPLQTFLPSTLWLQQGCYLHHGH